MVNLRLDARAGEGPAIRLIAGPLPRLRLDLESEHVPQIADRRAGGWEIGRGRGNLWVRQVVAPASGDGAEPPGELDALRYRAVIRIAVIYLAGLRIRR